MDLMKFYFNGENVKSIRILINLIKYKKDLNTAKILHPILNYGC